MVAVLIDVTFRFGKFPQLYCSTAHSCGKMPVLTTQESDDNVRECSQQTDSIKSGIQPDYQRCFYIIFLPGTFLCGCNTTKLLYSCQHIP